MKTKNAFLRFGVIGLLMTVLFVGLAACAAPSEPEDQQMEEMDHSEDMGDMEDPGGMGDMEDMGDMDEHEHDSMERIPNDRATIEIVSPAEGSSFASGEDVVIEVAIENFTLNQDGSHWHVYVDGESYGMVVGDTTTQVLRNLEPGTHEVVAYLANGDHEELEEGGIVHITVEE